MRKTMKIGFLGGIGPESTAVFYAKLIEKLQSKNIVEKNTDFPQIIINSIPAPELFNKDGSQVNLEIYLKGLKELDKHNLDLIVIICNTAHLYLDYFQKHINTKILNLVELVKKKITNVHSYSIIGSSTTINKKLYDFYSNKLVETNKTDLEKIDRTIYNFNLGIEKHLQKKIIYKVAEKYLNKGAEVILLGCTEISLMFEGTNYPVIDTFEVLIDNLVKIIHIGEVYEI